MISLVLDRSVFEYDGRGISQVTRMLYKTLMALYGSEIKLYCLCSKPLVVDLDFPYEEIRVPGSWEQAWSHRFADEVARRKVDFVHFPFNGNFSRRWGEVLSPKTKIISTIHDMIPFVLPDLNQCTADWLAQRKQDLQYFCDSSDVILTDSASSKSDILKFIDVLPRKVKVLYYAGFLHDIVPVPPPDYEYFLYNGGYDYRKGLCEMVDNFLQLKMRGLLRSKLLLTGKPQFLSHRLSSLIRYGLEQDWIVDMGYVSDAQLTGLFAGARALVYLSAYEGFGLPPLEAMGAGCPVITCRNSSLTEVCGDAVYYVDRADEPEIQRAFLRCENDNAYRDFLIEAGKIQAEQFSWSRSAEYLYQILKKLKYSIKKGAVV